jgi:hypothetical protein
VVKRDDDVFSACVEVLLKERRCAMRTLQANLLSKPSQYEYSKLALR